MKTYTGFLYRLPPNGVFVFGSNTDGRHGKGAALVAKKWFGAIHGQAQGLHGKSYAIITKNLRKHKQPSIEKQFIINQIAMLYSIADQGMPKHDFFVAYSAVGENLNGYTNAEMADMFSAHPIPGNIVFEHGFAKLLNQ